MGLLWSWTFCGVPHYWVAQLILSWNCWLQLQPRGQSIGREQEIIPPWMWECLRRGLHFTFKSIQPSSLRIYGELRARSSVINKSGLIEALDVQVPCLYCLNLRLCQYQCWPSPQGGQAGSSGSGCPPEVVWSVWQEERPPFLPNPTFSELPQEVDWKYSFDMSCHRHTHTPRLDDSH